MIAAMDRGTRTRTANPALPLSVETSLIPQPPAWALAMGEGEVVHRRVDGRGGAFEVIIRTGSEASLVCVAMVGVDHWTVESLETAVAEMIGATLEGLRGTACPEPVRLWNFLPGICAPVGDGLDRYRVFNRARHQVFEKWFGECTVREGALPTASCVGHHGRSIAIHALGMRAPALALENPRQVPAFAYSLKFGPKPPCFSRAGLVHCAGRRLLLVAGTASVRGEESVHAGSLEAQCRETVINLETVISAGRAAASPAGAPESSSAFDGLLASRIYYRNLPDLDRLSALLPTDLLACLEVEFVHADICREELLVEIELALDVGRG
jgi:hypothetical protein